jgi:beta-xylosidase
VDARRDPRHWYLTFGSFWGGIKLTAIDPDTGKPASDPPQLVSLARRPGVQSDPIEAHFIYTRTGFHYLFVSFDYYCRGTNSEYKVAVGRSASITGPYVDGRWLADRRQSAGHPVGGGPRRNVNDAAQPPLPCATSGAPGRAPSGRPSA